MRALVTGAAGFIGRHTVAPLRAAGFDVHAVTSHRTRDDSDATWHRANLNDSSERRSVLETVRPTHLLHLAWYTEHGKFWTSPHNLRWVATSLDLLLDFVEVGGRRVVVAGSCAEYDWSFGFCNEQTTPRHPATLYGAAKNVLYELSSAYAESVDLSFAWGRVFFLFGPGEPATRFVPSVATALLRGAEARCTAGEQRRDFLHVRDVADAFVALLRSDVQGAVNIASGEPRPLADIAHRLADQIGQPNLLRLGALPTPPNEAAVVAADVSRLRTELAWQPSLSLDEGLADVVASLRMSLVS